MGKFIIWAGPEWNSKDDKAVDWFDPYKNYTKEEQMATIEKKGFKYKLEMNDSYPLDEIASHRDIINNDFTSYGKTLLFRTQADALMFKLVYNW